MSGQEGKEQQEQQWKKEVQDTHICSSGGCKGEGALGHIPLPLLLLTNAYHFFLSQSIRTPALLNVIFGWCLCF